MASPSHDRHNFFRREIHDETKAFIWKIIVDLHLGFLMVPMAGFEPASLILWELCFTIKLHGQIQDAKEKIVGFEPTTDCLTDNYSTKWVKYFLNRKNCCVRLYYGCGGLDSNQRPLGYEPSELPTAPPRVVAEAGFEPAISNLWGWRDDLLLYPAMVIPTGFEPVTSAWKADDLGRLSMGP